MSSRKTKKHQHEHEHEHEHSYCAEHSDACSACIYACQKCYSHGVDMQNTGMHECIKKCLLCSKICDLCIHACYLGATYHDKIARLCYKMCKECRDECKKHHTHAPCQACAKACDRCIQVFQSQHAAKTKAFHKKLGISSHEDV